MSDTTPRGRTWLPEAGKRTPCLETVLVNSVRWHGAASSLDGCRKYATGVGRVPAPMLATSGQPPENSDLWAVEMKWDGMRAVCLVGGGEQVSLFSRNGRKATASFPELAAALADTAADRRFVIDGEVIAPDWKSGVPSFGRLQHRMHIARPPAGLIASVPVQLYVFDVLSIDDTDLTSRPYTVRRELLASLELTSTLVRVPPYWTDVAPEQMLDTAAEHGLEGIVSKRLDSIYRPGQRSRAWIKTALRRSADVVVAGWIPGSRPRSGVFGSLILGAHTPAGDFVYVGNVGTGFSIPQRRVLQAQLDEITWETSPFAVVPRFGPVPAYWVRTGSGGDGVLPGIHHHAAASQLGGSARRPGSPPCRPARLTDVNRIVSPMRAVDQSIRRRR